MSDNTPARVPLSLPAGTRLSDTYEIEGDIALGGMAEVYRAHNVHTGEPVAIKLVLPEFARDETILALFKKEATVLSRLRHNAIVHYHLFTIERQMDRPYLVMDFVDGMPLSDKLAGGPIDPLGVRQMLLRVAAGLELAHSFGVVHRDLSPDNIILPNGQMQHAMIIDFGIAKAATIGQGTVLGGNFAGKYNYVSPEQLGLYEGEIGQQSDIYSLGLVGAAALLGHPLDMSGSHAHVLEKRRAVPEMGDVDPGLKAVLEAMLRPAPADRPADMGAVIALLQGPPAVSVKTVIESKPETAPWAGPPAATPPPAARTVVAPVITARPKPVERPLFDPLKPTSGGGESPFGAYETPLGPSPTSAPPPRPAPRHRSFVPILALTVVLVAGGAAGVAYMQGWLDPVLAPAPVEEEAVEPPTTPVPDVLGLEEQPPTVEPPPEPEPEARPTILPPVQTGLGPSDPAIVDPLELTTQRMAWIASYPLQSCQYISAVAPAEDTVSIEGFATAAAVFQPLDTEFKAINGKDADIVLQPITEPQCAVADFLRAIDRITVPGPSLTLASRTARDGIPLAIDLSNSIGWTTSLFLVDEEGAIYDISGLLPESGDGSFELELNLSGTTQAVPAILLAVAFPPGRTATPLGDEDALGYLPKLALDVAKLPEQVSINAQYFTLSPD